MTPVARILVNVVPRRLARSPPTSGVQVLFREKAEMRRENSVLLVPISLERRDLRGPRMYVALSTIRTGLCGSEEGYGLVTSDTE